MVAVVLAGLLVGAVVGLRSRIDPQSASLQEHYLLLVSDLHAQGVPLSSVRDRLISVGYAEPSLAILSVADPLTMSPNKVDQQAADQLHQFAQALSTGADLPVASTPQVAPAALPEATATSLTVLVVDTQPTPTSVDLTAVPVVDTPAPVETAAPPLVIAPVPTTAPAVVKPAATKPAGQTTATVKSPDRQPVFYRKEPTAKGTVVGTLPYGATVTVLGIVQGQAILPGETHWDKILTNGHEGYVYGKYVQVGG